VDKLIITCVSLFSGFCIPKIIEIGSVIETLNGYHIFEKNVFISLPAFTVFIAFSALTLLVGRQEGHPACN